MTTELAVAAVQWGWKRQKTSLQADLHLRKNTFVSEVKNELSHSSYTEILQLEIADVLHT